MCSGGKRSIWVPKAFCRSEKKKKTPVNFNSRSGDDYSLLSDGTTGAGVSGAEVLAG